MGNWVHVSTFLSLTSFVSALVWRGKRSQHEAWGDMRMTFKGLICIYSSIQSILGENYSKPGMTLRIFIQKLKELLISGSQSSVSTSAKYVNSQWHYVKVSRKTSKRRNIWVWPVGQRTCYPGKEGERLWKRIGHGWNLVHLIVPECKYMGGARKMAKSWRKSNLARMPY